jgi:hypothetical protein
VAHYKGAPIPPGPATWSPRLGCRLHREPICTA